MAKTVVFLIALTLVSGQAAGQTLRGSLAVAIHQNREANRENLSRIENRKELRRFVQQGFLVPLPRTAGLAIDPRLSPVYRYCRPWTEEFLVDLGLAFHRTFGTVLQINSAVRTVAYQRSLQGRNGNAAPVTGPTASSHTTGATIDLAKLPLSRRQVAWLRNYLRKQRTAGRIEVAEEFVQSVFHVMVFKNYGRTETIAATDPPARKTTPKRKSGRKPHGPD